MSTRAVISQLRNRCFSRDSPSSSSSSSPPSSCPSSSPFFSSSPASRYPLRGLHSLSEKRVSSSVHLCRLVFLPQTQGGQHLVGVLLHPQEKRLVTATSTLPSYNCSLSPSLNPSKKLFFWTPRNNTRSSRKQSPFQNCPSSSLPPFFYCLFSSCSFSPGSPRFVAYQNRFMCCSCSSLSSSAHLREEESHLSSSSSFSPSSSSRDLYKGAVGLPPCHRQRQLERLASLVLSYVDDVSSDTGIDEEDQTEADTSLPSSSSSEEGEGERRSCTDESNRPRTRRKKGSTGGGSGYVSCLTENIFPLSLVESLREYRDICTERDVLTSLLYEENGVTFTEDKEEDPENERCKTSNRSFSSQGLKKGERPEGMKLQSKGQKMMRGRYQSKEEGEEANEDEDADMKEGEEDEEEENDRDLPQCLLCDPDWRDLHEKAKQLEESLREDLLLHRLSIHRGLRQLNSSPDFPTKSSGGGETSLSEHDGGDELEGDAVVEVQAGVGGEDAALFSRDLFCMYEVFASSQGWKWRVLDLMQTDRGGYRRATAEVEGKGAYGLFSLEAGVHRVQRIPPTETRGRMQTSASAVSVLPRSKDLEKKVDMSPATLKVEFMRSSGPGGQSVNKSETAVRLTHKPTGISVHCMQTQSQTENKHIAMTLLRDRLLQRLLLQETQQRDATQEAQMGTKDRSQKIRTYNFQRDVIIDHRCRLQLHGVEMFLKTSSGLEDVHEVLRKRREETQISELLSAIERSLTVEYRNKKTSSPGGTKG
ncbi:peptide chain release factor 1 [Cystoisospora suis]|uniref:Peptide chain release factor 1 n=1 Tax=Cystoisospora suis TaxID=483139 RepID=A0A2C6KQH7_9APIC|nr:peptide chain release factor 1 [Cystoisospora suis]